MTHVAEHTIVGVSSSARHPWRRVARHTRRHRSRDTRWPALAAMLLALRAEHRHSVRIVDADCGAGGLLLCAVRYARTIGFTAIEARGIGAAPALVRRARAAAAALHDPAIGLTFEAAGSGDALEDESDFPADIVLWHGGAGCSAQTARVVACAGQTLIADPVRAA